MSEQIATQGENAAALANADLPTNVASSSSENGASADIVYQRWGNENAVYRHVLSSCEPLRVFGRTEPGSDVPISLTVDARRCAGTEEIDLSRSTITYRGEVIELGDQNLLSAYASENTRMIKGNDGRNHLQAGDAGTELIGGKGADTLTGGSGVDQFVFHHPGDSNLRDGYDSIYNFDCGQDKIVISAEGWFPKSEDDRYDPAGLLKNLVEIEARGHGWWQVTIPSTSKDDPDFYLMVQPNCPRGGLSVDDFTFV
jgi:Ca2+-binding RTX toxin-like protein